MLCAAPLYFCITAIISEFSIFYFQYIYLQNSLYKYNTFLYFHIIIVVQFLITSFFFFMWLLIFIACSNDSQNFSCNLYPCIDHTYFLSLNGNVVDIEKPDEICPLACVVHNFLGLFLHPSIFSCHGLKICVHNKWWLIRFLILIKL